MKRIAIGLLLLALVSCRGRHSRRAVQNEEPATETPAAPTLASSIKSNDPRVASQFASGFYGIEAKSWRWTARQFSAVLKPPVGAAQSGAALRFTFSIPEVVLNAVKQVKLTASVGGKALKTETYTKPGAATLIADVPAAELTGDSVTVNFAMDKALQPGAPGGDSRELGLIADTIRLEPK